MQLHGDARTCVVVSPSVLGRGMTPLSTLIPGRIPFALSTSTKGFPSLPSWYSVSSNRIWAPGTHSKSWGLRQAAQPQMTLLWICVAL